MENKKDMTFDLYLGDKYLGELKLSDFKNEIPRNIAWEIAKLTEKFFCSALNPWDFDDGYPDAETIYQDIIEDPKAVRNFIGDIVSENNLSCYEAELAKEILSALCKDYFC